MGNTMRVAVAANHVAGRIRRSASALKGTFRAAREADPADLEARKLRIRLQLLEADAAALAAEAEQLLAALAEFSGKARGLRVLPLDDVEMVAEQIRGWLGEHTTEFENEIVFADFTRRRYTPAQVEAGLKNLEAAGLIVQVPKRGRAKRLPSGARAVRFRVVHEKGGAA